MPVRKYRSVEDMPRPAPLAPLRAENLEAACELTEMAYRMRPWRFVPGVHKYRSIEEANLRRARWEAETIRAHRRL